MKTSSSFKKISKEFHSGTTFIAFDTETTGLRSTEEYVIELGAVKFNCNGTIGKPFDMLIKPPKYIPSFITDLTGITNAMVKDCPSAKQVILEFLNYIEDENTILLAHNANFDMKFIESEMERNNLETIKNKTVDTLAFTRFLFPELNKTEGKGQYKLQSLAQRFNIEVFSAHRANDDARVCMEVFKRLILEFDAKNKKN